MAVSLDKITRELRKQADNASLVSLEARIWQRIEASRPSALMARSLLVLRLLPIIIALGLGGTVGARAMTSEHELSAFSAIPAYSVLRLVE